MQISGAHPRSVTPFGESQKTWLGGLKLVSMMWISHPFFEEHWSIELFSAMMLHSSVNTWLALHSFSQIILYASISLSFKAGEHSSSVRFRVEKGLYQLKFVLLYLFHAFNSCRDCKYGQLDPSSRCYVLHIVDIFPLCQRPEPSCTRMNRSAAYISLSLFWVTTTEDAEAQRWGGVFCPGLQASILCSLANWSIWVVVSSRLDTFKLWKLFLGKKER